MKNLRLNYLIKYRNYIFTFSFLLYSLFFIYQGFTFVPLDVEVTRSNQVLVIKPTTNSIDKYYDSHRDADQVFYHVKMLELLLKAYKSDLGYYSPYIFLGYPLESSIEVVKGISFYIGIVAIKVFDLKTWRAALLGADLALIIWTLLGFIVSTNICKIINIDKKIDWIICISVCSAFFSYTYESILISNVGYLFLILGFLRVLNYLKLGLVYSAVGSFLILFSNDFHSILYFPIILVLIFFWCIRNIDFLSTLKLSISWAMPGLFFLNKFNDLLVTMSLSLQNFDSDTSLISRMYHPLLFTSILDFPIFSFIKNNYLSGNYYYEFLFPDLSVKMGLILSIIGIYFLFKKFSNFSFRWEVLICLLIIMGPVHYILGILIPLISNETSIRFHTIVHIFLSFFAAFQLSHSAIKKEVYLRRVILLLLCLFLLQFIAISLNDCFKNLHIYWISGLFSFLALLFLYFHLKYTQTIYLVLSLAILPFSNALGYSGMTSFIPIEISKNSVHESLPSIDFNTKTALVISNKFTRKIHPNSLISLNLAVPEGYATPAPKNIIELVAWNRMSYENKIDNLDNHLKNKLRYTDISSILEISNSKLSYKNKVFLSLLGIDYVIVFGDKLESDLLDFSNYGDAMISNSKFNTVIGTVVCSSRVFNNISEFEKANDFNNYLNKPYLILKNKISIDHSKCPESISSLNYESFSKITVKTDLSEWEGIIPTKLRFDPRLTAYNDEGNIIQIVECNFGLACLITREGGKIFNVKFN